MKNFIKRIVKRIGDKVKDVFDMVNKFTIHSEFIFNEVLIHVKTGRKVVKVSFKEVFKENMNNFSIMQSLNDLEEMNYRYFHIREYSNGLFMYCSNDGGPVYSVNDRYRTITIPINQNRQSILMLLENLLMAREFYGMYLMNDVEADLHGNSILLGSAITEIDAKLYRLATSFDRDEIEDEHYDAYVLKPINIFTNWLIMTPLECTNINEFNENGIIITKKQLEENIFPPLDFFSIVNPDSMVAIA